jgi:hypothetical protein
MGDGNPEPLLQVLYSTCSLFTLQREVRMKRAVLLFAVLPPLFTLPALAQMPEISAQAVCNARAADARILRSAPMQSTAECVHDEENAKQQLGSIWDSTSAAIRRECESDGRAMGTTSYLDLLTCVQMAEDMKSGPQKQAIKQ